MANNCLVTKLKGVVDNDGLSKLGTLKLKISSAAPGQVVANGLRTFGAANTISVIGSGYLNDDPTIKQIQGPSLFIFSDGDYYIEMTNKYDITGIMTMNGFANIEFDIADLAYCDNMSYMDLYNSNVYGDLSSFKNSSFLNLIDFLISETKVTGNIKYIGFPSVTSIMLNDLVEGDFVEFVESCIEKGRASRDIANRINLGRLSLLPKITFSQTPLSANGTAYLTWESASKIVIYVGGDPNPAIGGNYHTIYAKGATAEEIAAWEQAGKTVVVVS